MSLGRSDWSHIKPTFCFPPPPFFPKYQSFFGPRPSLQKQNYKCKHKYKDNFLTTNKRQIRWLRIFSLGSWLQIWHLVDTLLTPCWHLVDTLLVIFPNVRMYKCAMCNCDNMTFSAMPSSLAMAKYFHAKWTIHFFQLPWPNIFHWLP